MSILSPGKIVFLLLYQGFYYLDLIRKVIELKSRRSDIGSVGNWHRLFLHLFG